MMTSLTNRLIAPFLLAGALAAGAQEHEGLQVRDLGGGVKVMEFTSRPPTLPQKKQEMDAAIERYPRNDSFYAQTGIRLYGLCEKQEDLETLTALAKRVPACTKQYIKHLAVMPQRDYDRLMEEQKGTCGCATNFGDILLVKVMDLTHESGHVHHMNLDRIIESDGSGVKPSERFKREWLAVANIDYGALTQLGSDRSAVWRDAARAYHAASERLIRKNEEIKARSKEIDARKGSDQYAGLVQLFNESARAFNAERERVNRLWLMVGGAGNGCVTAYAGTSFDEDVAETTRVANDAANGDARALEALRTDQRLGKKVELLHRYKFVTDETYTALVHD